MKGVRVLAGLAVVLAAALAGGLALGATWSSTRENGDYRVSTRLTARSQVEIPTTIGTATFDTHRWGPGVRVRVSALALPAVGRSAESPFIDLPAQLAQISGLARDAATVTLAKLGGGAVAGGVVGALVWQGLVGTRSRRRAWLGAVVGGVGAGAAVSLGWTAGAFLTFDEEYGRHLRADGLLAVGLSTDELLEELNARDQAYAGYVQSLATYIAQLREQASPGGSVEPSVRVLLVSDVHGRNVYPQLRSVVQSQGVDFVVDSGDLVQWGTGLELAARPDLAAGIESLGVPYLFVKGNHDGPGTVAELRELDNVRVLDGEAAQVFGLSVLGVGDPRLYQDGGPVESEEPEEVEEIERARAAEAADARGTLRAPPDLAVMHHPSGARELGALTAAPVWVSGHTHEPALDVDDTRIDLTVGTTGAAGIRTFTGQDEDGEVVPTPQSFDILGFDSRCRPVSLTRLTYPDVLSDVGNARVTYQTFQLDDEGEDRADTRSCS